MVKGSANDNKLINTDESESCVNAVVLFNKLKVDFIPFSSLHLLIIFIYHHFIVVEADEIKSIIKKNNEYILNNCFL
ncbi:hypothetical protein CPS_2426 [Colwellia psychrerythraea 34H]|uniref:Uncharacterized protein n=1 Tax=Colwellia psychrerythraea (strain 34H / ATCC BAA-681) TaxID=167879 RepID=Q481X6_COLP3|nr:hypothetical protein CPS_2426 [Colwellia psychrerythraea 34H]